MADVPSTTARVFVSQTSEADRYLPEGPRALTVGGREAVSWVNIQTGPDATTGAIHLRFWDTGERRIVPTSSRPGFHIPTDRPDVVFVGQGKSVGTLNLVTGEWTELGRIPDHHPRTIINEGNVTPSGKAVVFGTKDVQFAEPIAHLYLFTVDDCRMSILADRQTCSNGKVFEHGLNDALLLYDIDTPRKEVTRYRLDVHRGTACVEGVAIDLRGLDAFPDGMVESGDRTAIIAFYNPHRGGDGHARRYSLVNGELLEEFVLPGSPRVTCPLLVERDGGVRLILTTAVEGMPEEQRKTSPHAGDLFIADTRLKGVPPAGVVRLG